MAFFMVEGSGMLSLLTEGHPLIRKVLFGFGIVFAVLAVALAVIWLTSAPVDTSPTELQQIEQTLQEIKILLEQLAKK